MELRKSSSDRLFAFVLTGAYAIWVLFVALHHEPWRDEADAWLAARDMSPIQLFHWLGGAGTPGLWYLLLMPLAKLGLPYISMSVLHACIAIAVAAVIAFCAPFPRLFKVLILFSYCVVYEYAVIARSYVITELLLLLIAMALCARVRRQWLIGLLLCLLFNTNAHGFLIAGIISACLIVEAFYRREISNSALIGLAIAAAGGFAAFLQLLPPAHPQALNTAPQWLVGGDVFSQCFFQRLPPYIGFYQKWARGRMWAAWPAYVAVRVFCFALFLSIIYLARRSVMAVTIVLISSLAIIYVCIFKWYGGERHADLIFVLLLFLLWMSRWPMSGNSRLQRIVPCAFMATLIFAVVTGAIWSIKDIFKPYSGAKEAAEYIAANHLTSTPIAAIRSAHCEAILPYLPGEKFWYVGREQYGTYLNWDSEWNKDYHLKEAELLRRVDRQFPDRNNLLLVATQPLSNPDAAGYRLIFQNRHMPFDPSMRDETYFLYARAKAP